MVRWMNYRFEWDPGKAVINIQKHKTQFEIAAAVFMDPRAITIYDKDHSHLED